MKINDVNTSGKSLVLAKSSEVDALENEWWIAFPTDYREYVTKLGEGVLGGSFVRIYPPWRIHKELAEWRRRINKYWFWDKGGNLLPKERALECVIVGDTTIGDELVFHPLRPNQLFVLPRESETIFAAGADICSAVDWMCSSGKLVDAFSERDFEPFDSRLEAEDSERTNDVDGESLDNLVELGQQWAKRRAIRKLALEDLQPHTGNDKKTTLLHESIVLAGGYPYGAGYLVVYRVDDNATGLEIGLFTWQMKDDSKWLQYEPNEVNLAKLAKK